MPYNARFLYQQPKTEINNYLIVNWFSLPLQTVEKHLVSNRETLGLYSEKLSFQLVGCQQGYLHKTAETDTFRTKSVCFGIKVLYSGADLRSDTLFPFSDCCYIGNISFEERVTVLVFAHYPAESINQ